MPDLEDLHVEVCEAMEAGLDPAEVRRRILKFTKACDAAGLTATAAKWRELLPQ